MLPALRHPTPSAIYTATSCSKSHPHAKPVIPHRRAARMKKPAPSLKPIIHAESSMLECLQASPCCCG